jgi:hypothetical protein
VLGSSMIIVQSQEAGETSGIRYSGLFQQVLEA